MTEWIESERREAEGKAILEANIPHPVSDWQTYRGRARRMSTRRLPAGRWTHPLGRAALLNDLAAKIERRADELAAIDVADNDSPLKEMRRDVDVASPSSATSPDSRCRYVEGPSRPRTERSTTRCASSSESSSGSCPSIAPGSGESVTARSPAHLLATEEETS